MPELDELRKAYEAARAETIRTGPEASGMTIRVPYDNLQAVLDERRRAADLIVALEAQATTQQERIDALEAALKHTRDFGRHRALSATVFSFRAAGVDYRANAAGDLFCVRGGQLCALIPVPDALIEWTYPPDPATFVAGGTDGAAGEGEEG